MFAKLQNVDTEGVSKMTTNFILFVDVFLTASTPCNTISASSNYSIITLFMIMFKHPHRLVKLGMALNIRERLWSFLNIENVKRLKATHGTHDANSGLQFQSPALCMLTIHPNRLPMTSRPCQNATLPNLEKNISMEHNPVRNCVSS